MNYLEANKKAWNTRTKIHLTSDFYDIEGFKKTRNSLKPVELELLGDIKGKKILHLQCHFGQDTLSLQHMGAEVTGVDLSDEAIKAAQKLNDEMGLGAKFVCCDVFETDKYIDEKFDIVFTTYGVIGWLPELKTWSRIINHFLKPGGQLIFVEFHPVVWLFDEFFTKIEYSYFNIEKIIDIHTGTYTDGEQPTLEDHNFNHPLCDVFSNLIDNKLQITHFQEYDYSPYDCFDNTVKCEGGWQIKGMEQKMPLIYSLVASKPA